MDRITDRQLRESINDLLEAWLRSFEHLSVGDIPLDISVVSTGMAWVKVRVDCGGLANVEMRDRRRWREVEISVRVSE
jgi:hypothetical protein